MIQQLTIFYFGILHTIGGLINDQIIIILHSNGEDAYFRFWALFSIHLFGYINWGKGFCCQPKVGDDCLHPILFVVK